MTGDGHPFRDAPAQHRLANTRIERSPRTAGLVGAIAISLIWEALGAYVLVVKSESIFTAATVVLLMVFGLGILAYGIHEALSLLDPIVELYVSDPEPAVGEPLDVRWEVKGRASRIRELSIAITGTEVATSTRTSDDASSTETEVFFREPFVVARDPRVIAAGTARVVLDQAVPTWNGGNNKIVWSIEITGDIAHWPDITDSFEIRVVGSPRARHREVA